MSKILITADIHFGVPGRLNDILYACRVMREYCKLSGIDTAIILGDLYHDRRYLEIDVLSASYKFFEEANEEYGQQWIVFPGNHDMYQRHSWDINSLTPLKKHLTVIEDTCKIQIDNRNFFILPFIQFEKVYMQVLKTINDMATEDDVLLTHIGVCGAVMNTCFMLKDWGLVSFQGTKFKRVYTGHFHSRQTIDDHVFYPGSPIPFKHDEGNVPHGFYILDTETMEHKFVNIWKAGKRFFPNETPPAQYCSVVDSDIDNLDAEEIEHNNIRIAISEDVSPEKRQEIEKTLKEKGAAGITWMILKNDTAEIATIENSLSKSDLFEIFLSNDTKGIKDLNVDLLRKLNAEIVRDGDEQYSYTIED